jgi:hypothetical protein
VRQPSRRDREERAVSAKVAGYSSGIRSPSSVGISSDTVWRPSGVKARPVVKRVLVVLVAM